MPGKGAFKRCVDKVSRKGVDDPAAVCAASIARKRGRTRGRVNGQTANERALIAAGKKMAAAKLAPVAVMLNPPKHFYTAVERGRKVYYHDANIGRRLVKYPTEEAKLLIETGQADERPKKARQNPGTRRNHHNDQAAIDAFRDFHGEDPQEIIEFDSVHHYPGRTAALGDLVQLKIRIPRERDIEGGRVVTLKDFGEAWLTRHPTMRQLYAEGGDQSIDLEEFGLDSSNPNEVEYLGELTRCLYFTRKVHLGRDGGTANYDHKFGQVEGEHELGLSKTELIKVGYHVPDERLIFMGGGYTIPAEGIDG